MAKVEGIKELYKTIDRMVDKHTGPKSVSVGYTVAYAMPVHENMTAYHKRGQAKFLEQPARTFRKVMQEIIIKGLKRGLLMIDCLVLAGLRLQRESQKLVPIDTGALRNSAFTRKNG